MDILSGCFWLVRREANWIRVGVLDESFFMYGEDMDWCLRFWSCGWKLVFLPSAEAIHYGGASSANAPVSVLTLRCSGQISSIWRKHHSKPNSCMLLPNCMLAPGIEGRRTHPCVMLRPNGTRDAPSEGQDGRRLP